MILSLSTLPITWAPLNLNNPSSEERVAERLAEVLHSWENTPYNPHQAAKGVGVYCTAFVCGVLDELYRRERPTPLNAIPHDVSMHCPATARGGLRWFLRHFPTAQRIWATTWADRADKVEVQPGDVLITGPVGGGRGHAIMIGPRRNTMWQALGSCVHYTGFAVPSGQLLYAVYRFTDKEAWI